MNLRDKPSCEATLQPSAPSNDIDDLMKIINGQECVIEEKEVTIKEKDATIRVQEKRIALLEEFLRLERARRYGRSSERFEGQGELFDELEIAADGEEDQQLPATDPQKKPFRKGRKPISSSLPRHPVYLYLSDEEKAGALDTFFSKVKEELDIVPAKVRVLEYWQEKAVFASDSADDSERQIKSAQQPKHPIMKSVASTDLLAHIIVSKYCDALPLYRQEKILERYGGSITRTTMANWLIRLSGQLQPLINLMREQQMTGKIIQADETRIQVLGEKSKSINSDKYMWVSLGGPPDCPSVLFEYDPSRSKAVPLRLFEGFSGYLQTDGYAAYDAVCKKQEITRVGCFDHARRKFMDVKKSEAKPGKKQKKKAVSGKVSKADVALGKIRKLYQIEDRVAGLSANEKKHQRQLHSKPVLDDLKAWLDKNLPMQEPGSGLHTAMQYAVNQWPRLIEYCNDGDLKISNAGAENAIRPFTIGRKNWLFAATPRGAQASATYYSLIESAKLNGLEPFEYLRHILKYLPYAETVEALEQLLPWAVEQTALKKMTE